MLPPSLSPAWSSETLLSLHSTIVSNKLGVQEDARITLAEQPAITAVCMSPLVFDDFHSFRGSRCSQKIKQAHTGNDLLQRTHYNTNVEN